MPTGRDLIARCKEHVLDTMRSMPDCQPNSGKGAGYRAIELEADFDLDLSGQNGWLTHSFLRSLAEDAQVEVVPGTESRRKYRLKQ